MFQYWELPCFSNRAKIFSKKRQGLFVRCKSITSDPELECKRRDLPRVRQTREKPQPKRDAELSQEIIGDRIGKVLQPLRNNKACPRSPRQVRQVWRKIFFCKRIRLLYWFYCHGTIIYCIVAQYSIKADVL